MDESKSQGGWHARGRGERGRRGSTRKTELVLRILKGEDVDTLSREVKVPIPMPK
jgi:hypothetical protein